MANGIRTGDPRGSIKGVVRSSVKVPEFAKQLKKAGGHIDRNVVEITMKDEDNSPKTLNDKKGEIHYMIHQISTNKNSQSKMNQLRKIETPPKQTLHNKTT